MNLITNSADLERTIKQLELQQANELFFLKEEFSRTSEALRPANIIRNTLKNAFKSPDVKSDVLNTAIGLTTGLLAKKLVIGKTLNPFKKVLGIIIEMVVANKAVKNADGIKSTGSVIFNKLFSKKEQPVNHNNG